MELGAEIAGFNSITILTFKPGTRNPKPGTNCLSQLLYIVHFENELIHFDNFWN
jgi:hypothetical protein